MTIFMAQLEHSMKNTHSQDEKQKGERIPLFQSSSTNNDIDLIPFTKMEDLEEAKIIWIQDFHLAPKPLAFKRLMIKSQSIQS